MTYIDPRLVRLIGKGMRLVGNERTTRRVLQHDVAYLSDAKCQGIRSTCSGKRRYLSQHSTSLDIHVYMACPIQINLTLLYTVHKLKVNLHSSPEMVTALSVELGKVSPAT